jgi:hypothetical protein
VSSVFAAPVISGNSLFVVGYHVAGGAGISVFQFDKRDLTVTTDSNLGAALNAANVIPPGGLTYNATIGRVTPTPAAQSGGTLYITDWAGGVTLYDTQDLTQLFAYGTDFGLPVTASGVTASPVASATRLLIPWTSSVSCFATNPGSENVAGGSGVSLVWEYDFDEGAGVGDNRYQIWSTPAMSNGHAWVTVLDTASGNASTIWRFALNDTFDGNPTVVSTEPQMYAAPIVVGDNRDDDEDGNLWFCSYNPTVDRIDQSAWASAANFWAQFKFDGARGGDNTIEEDDDVPPGDSSGCFISTLK